MEGKRSLHLKVQEMCDCFAATDYFEEMKRVAAAGGDREEASLKWIALAVLHGINSDARKISISRSGDGAVKVRAKYGPAELPSPGPEVGGAVMDTVKEILHFGGGRKEKSPWAMGIRDGSVDLGVKVEREDGLETITLKFPK